MKTKPSPWIVQLGRGHTQVEQGAFGIRNTRLIEMPRQVNEQPLPQHGALSKARQALTTHGKRFRISVEAEQDALWSHAFEQDFSMPTPSHCPVAQVRDMIAEEPIRNFSDHDGCMGETLASMVLSTHIHFFPLGAEVYSRLMSCQ